MKRFPAAAVSRRGLLTLGATGALAALLPGCGSGSDANAAVEAAGHADRLRVSYQLPYIVGSVLSRQELLTQALARYGTEVELQVLTPAVTTESLGGGALDLALGGFAPSALAAYPLRVVAVAERSPASHAIVVRADSGITSLDGLRGRKFAATGVNLPSNYLLGPYSRQTGFSLDGIEYVKLPVEQLTSALLSRSVDAIQIWDPYYASLEVTGQVRVLLDGTDHIANYVPIWGQKRFIDDYPETVKEFLRTYHQGLTWVRDNHDAALEIFREVNKLTQEVAELTFSRRNYVLTPPDADFLADSKLREELQREAGGLKDPIDWDDAIDETILAQALGNALSPAAASPQPSASAP